MKRKEPSRPLIEEAEGRDADRRASLYAAFKRIANRTDRPAITNLHVRELLMWVMAADRNGSGVQKSYPELAAILETTVSTARAVVRRAEKEFGLLAVIEDRHARGGQTANRYSIDWPVVREINMGVRPAVVSQQAPAATRQAPVVSQQAPVVTRQPYKEYIPESYPEAKASPSSPPVATSLGVTRKAVEEVLIGLGVIAWDTALRNAEDRGVGLDHVMQLIEFWKTHRPRWTLGALVFRIGKAHPSRSPEHGWPDRPSQDAPGTLPARRSANSTADPIELIRSAILRANRDASPEAKRQRIREGLVAQGIDPELHPEALEV